MQIKNILQLEKALLGFKKVTLSSIPLIGISKRFCVYNKPFVAFSNNGEVIHIKLPAHIARELKLRFGCFFAESNAYKSSRWLCFGAEFIEKMSNSIDVFNLLKTSIKTALNELTVHYTLDYLSEYGDEYNLSAKKVLEAFSEGIMGG